MCTYGVSLLLGMLGVGLQLLFGAYTHAHAHHTRARPPFQPGVVEVLVRSAEADVNVRDWSWSTPLHYAAAGGHGAVVEVLWPKRADLDAADAAGRTPLHLAVLAAAARLGDDVVGKLIIAGCDVSAADDEGLTAGHLAAFNGGRACAMRQRHASRMLGAA